MNTDSTLFSHIKPGDTEYKSGGLRDFFVYRSLGIDEATYGRVIAQLVKANKAPEEGTGWHVHEADFHIVYMVKGWARFMYEDRETLVSAGDCVHQAPGINTFCSAILRTWNIWKLSAQQASAVAESMVCVTFQHHQDGEKYLPKLPDKKVARTVICDSMP